MLNLNVKDIPLTKNAKQYVYLLIALFIFLTSPTLVFLFQKYR
jgi:hypothetical protein